MTISSLVTAGYIADPFSVSKTIVCKEEIVGIVDDVVEELSAFIIDDCSVPLFAIQSFSAVGALIREVGEPVIVPAFLAAYLRPPTAAVLTDSDGNPPKDVTGTPNAFSSDWTFTKVLNGGTVVFTLTADDGGPPAVATVMMTWLPRVFTGVTSNPGPYTEADIEALIQQNLAFDPEIVTTLSPVNQYIVHAYPDSYGHQPSGNFKIGDAGLPGDMTEIQSGLNITNAFAVTQGYRVARSDNLLDVNLGGGDPIAFEVTC